MFPSTPGPRPPKPAYEAEATVPHTANGDDTTDRPEGAVPEPDETPGLPDRDAAERPGDDAAERPGDDAAERPGDDAAERPGDDAAESPEGHAEPADEDDADGSDDEAGVEPDQPAVEPLPTMIKLRALGEELDEIDAILVRLDEDPVVTD